MATSPPLPDTELNSAGQSPTLLVYKTTQRPMLLGINLANTFSYTFSRVLA